MNPTNDLNENARMVRLEAQITPELHASLQRAAEIQGRTTTDFVIAALQESARRALQDVEVIRLSLADQQHLADALLNPPTPSPALQRALQRRATALRHDR